MWKGSEKSQVFCILLLILAIVTDGGLAIFAICLSALYGIFAVFQMIAEAKEKP